jgi:putative hydrolase of the HAD superfamily
MNGKRLIFWDFHGTLSYQNGGWTGAIADALNELQPELGVTPDDVRPLVQTGFPWQAPKGDYRHLRDPERWWDALTPVFERVLEGVGAHGIRADAAIARVRAQYVDPAAHALFPDVLPALGGLAKAGWKQVILSNHVPELPEIADGLGLTSLVSEVITSALVGFEKPHAGIFRYALQCTGARPQVDDVWMIGDNFVADVGGARAMGLEAILVRKEHPEAERYAPDLDGVLRILSSRSA